MLPAFHLRNEFARRFPNRLCHRPRFWDATAVKSFPTTFIKETMPLRGKLEVGCVLRGELLHFLAGKAVIVYSIISSILIVKIADLGSLMRYHLS
jgi:hypothetical protein